MHSWNLDDRLLRLSHRTKINNTCRRSHRSIPPAMDLSSSIFDFDFGAGFDDFDVKAFDDFGADFQQAFDFDFGTAFDAGFSNFEGSVTAEFDDESVGDWSGGIGRPRQRRRV